VDEALGRGASVICLPGGRLGAREDFEAERNRLYALANPRNVSGVVSWTTSLSGAAGSGEVAAFVEGLSCGATPEAFPVVTVSQPVAGRPLVAFDAYRGMKALVEHLVDSHGLVRIAFARGPANHVSAEQRYGAYRDALEGRGIPFKPELVTEPLPWDAGSEAAVSLLDGRGLLPGRDFQALVAASDLLAFWAMKEFLGRGWRVPEDLAITGFNDSLESAMAAPALSTVAVDFHREGRVAADILLRRLAGEAVPAETLLPAELRLRRSCGCPTAVLEAPGPRDVSHNVGIPAAGPGRKALVATLAGLLGARPQSASPWLEELLSALARETGGPASAFLPALELALDRTSPDDLDPAGWQACLSVLRRHVGPGLEEVFDRARVLASEASRRAETYSHWQADQRAEALRRLGAALLSCHEVGRIGEVLSEQLPRLGIPSFWLALEEEGSPARLVASSCDGRRYAPEGAGDGAASGIPFDPLLVLPPELLPAGRSSALVVEPLFFRGETLGRLVLEIGPQEGAIYEDLRGYVSSALRGASLFAEAGEARRRAEAADTIKSRLLANVTRELCEPLERIISAAEEGEATAPGPAQTAASVLASIRREAGRQLDLIEELLDLSRADIGELDLSFSAVDLLSLLRTSAGSASSGGDSIDLFLELPARLPLLRADPRRLEQALRSIIAFLAGESRGSRFVLSARLELPRVVVEFRREGGKGTSRPAVREAMEDLAGSDAATGKGSGDSGLGLSVARRILALHGATIDEAVHGEGVGDVLYRMSFPLPTLSGPPAHGAAASTPKPGILALCPRGQVPESLAALASSLAFPTVSSWRAAYSPEDCRGEDEAFAPVLLADLDEAGPRDWILYRHLRADSAVSRLPFAAFAVGTAGGPAGEEVRDSDFLGLLERAFAGGRKGPVFLIGTTDAAREYLVSLAESLLPGRRRRSFASAQDAARAAALARPSLVLADPESALAWGGSGEIGFPEKEADFVPLAVILPDREGQGYPAGDWESLVEITDALLLPQGLLPAAALSNLLEALALRGPGLPSHTRGLVRRAELWLLRHHAEAVTRSDLAGVLGVNEDYLGRVFRQELGLSPWEFLGRCRIRHAQLLLESGDESLATIAAAVGFSDQAYFSRVFRKYVGESPLVFRSRRQGRSE
jgi:AraC-like DNA-binding protein/signal transduction histidine kinase